MTSTAVLASVTGLTYRYAPLEPDVLRDISLTIHAGEVVALTGPSGSGKTTLLSLLGMMRRVEPGRIHLFDTDVGTANAREITGLRRRVRFIFQKHYLLRSLTAEQNVMAGAVTNPATDRRTNEERALALLTAFGLGDDTDKWPDQLSVGQQQRVAVARSLINQPELLLADEPTASLDRSSARLVVDRIFDAARTLHCGVLISTHDESIMASAVRCVQLRDGMLLPTTAG
jgi:ABC-type lipoprotein export system ATPase subunit